MREVDEVLGGLVAVGWTEDISELGCGSGVGGLFHLERLSGFLLLYQSKALMLQTIQNLGRNVFKLLHF